MRNISPVRGIAVLDIVPAGARAYLKRELRASPVSAPHAALCSIDEVYSAHVSAGLKRFDAHRAAAAWAAHKLCTDVRMHEVWVSIERARSAGTCTELGAIAEAGQGLGASFLSRAAAFYSIEVAKAQWSELHWSNWLDDLNKAIGKVAGVLAQNPGYDSVMLFNGTGSANSPDPLETLSGKLKSYHAKLAGLTTGTRPKRGNRTDFFARRQQYAVGLDNWMRSHMGRKNQKLVVICVKLVFGSYSETQLARDTSNTLT